MAQEQLNDYKYVIVPKKFDGFKRENQHQTSTLIKYLFTEKGLLTVYEDELPSELNNNRCLGLLVSLIDDSSMFTTKTALALKDCQGQEVFVTKEGKSKEKDYKDAFGEAIRDAFTSFNTLNYTYNGKSGDSEPITVSFKNDVKNIDKEEASFAKNREVMVEQQATLDNQSYKDNRPKSSHLKKGEEKREMVKQMARREQQSYEDNTPKSSNIKDDESIVNKATSLPNVPGKEVLYAQKLPNGYQLVDSTPKIQLKLYKSSLPNYYLAEADDKHGMVFEKNGKWIFEYYSGEKLMVEELDIKF